MTEAIVQLEAVNKYYQDGRQQVAALQDVKLSICSGDFLTLCGPSGSGKTTLLNVIGALDKPDSGEIRVLNRSLTAMSPNELTLFRRHTVGFVFQAFNLIPVMTALENTAFTLGLQGMGIEERNQKAAEALGLVGLAGLENRFPNQLSGGQQQRVAVARAIAARPALVLADEPTANLDSKSAADFLDVMQALNRDHKITFVFSTHDPRIVERARRVVLMKDGRIVPENSR